MSASTKAHAPELKRYMDKKLHMKLNANREIEGILRGFDPFMNLVLDEAIEFTKEGTKKAIGMIAVRGNSVVMMESKDKVERCQDLSTVSLPNQFCPKQDTVPRPRSTVLLPNQICPKEDTVSAGPNMTLSKIPSKNSSLTI